MSTRNIKSYDTALHILLGSFFGLTLSLLLFGLNASRASHFTASLVDLPNEANIVDQDVFLAEENLSDDLEPVLETSVYTHILLEDGSVIEK
jgi:hypothetical protein